MVIINLKNGFCLLVRGVQAKTYIYFRLQAIFLMQKVTMMNSQAIPASATIINGNQPNTQRCYSAPVREQTQVHNQSPYSHNSTGQLSDTSRKGQRRIDSFQCYRGKTLTYVYRMLLSIFMNKKYSTNSFVRPENRIRDLLIATYIRLLLDQWQSGQQLF